MRLVGREFDRLYGTRPRGLLNGLVVVSLLTRDALPAFVQRECVGRGFGAPCVPEAFVVVDTNPHAQSLRRVDRDVFRDSEVFDSFRAALQAYATLFDPALRELDTGGRHSVDHHYACIQVLACA